MAKFLPNRWLRRWFHARADLDLRGQVIADGSAICAFIMLVFVPLQWQRAPWHALITAAGAATMIGICMATLRDGAGRGLANMLVGAVTLAILLMTGFSGGAALGPIAAVPTVIVLACLILPREDIPAWVIVLVSTTPVAWLLSQSGVVFPLAVDKAFNETSIIRLPLLMTIVAALVGLTYRRAMDQYKISVEQASAAWSRASDRADRDHERLLQFADMAAEVLWETDAEFRLTYVSRGFARVFGVGADASLGLTPAEFYQRFSGLDADFERYLSALRTHQAFRDQRLKWRRGGKEVYLSNSGRPINDQKGQFAGYRGVIHDVTELVQLQRELRRRAARDSLTGLANRRAFIEAWHEAFAFAVAQQSPMALLFIDLDHFKRINDTAGHDTGDEMLILMAERLTAAFPDGAIGRLGGDEFVCFIADANEQRVIAQTERFLASLNEVGLIRAGKALRLGASVGIKSGVPANAGDAERWLQDADNAAYAAKSSGRGRCHVQREVRS